jgi:hypothetical protein
MFALCSRTEMGRRFIATSSSLRRGGVKLNFRDQAPRIRQMKFAEGLMKWVALILGGMLTFGGVLAVVVGVVFFGTSYPPQPRFGFTGDWRVSDVFGTEERPLAPANEIWRDYSTWQPQKEGSRRVYIARLGGAEHQSNFFASTNSGDTPMGAQKYTDVDFIYSDLTNGVYKITWSLRGEHDPSFLRFDGHYRFYQVELVGQTNQYPPMLAIRAIEGIKPED